MTIKHVHKPGWRSRRVRHDRHVKAQRKHQLESPQNYHHNRTLKAGFSGHKSSPHLHNTSPPPAPFSPCHWMAWTAAMFKLGLTKLSKQCLIWEKEHSWPFLHYQGRIVWQEAFVLKTDFPSYPALPALHWLTHYLWFPTFVSEKTILRSWIS